MLDQYWHGASERVSPEAPVLVVNVDKQLERAGGAANVALNIASLGAKVKLDGVIGADDHGKRLSNLLIGLGVNCCFVPDKNVATVTKLRVVSHNQQLVRLDFEEKAATAADALIARYPRIAEEVDVVVLSDYAKGALHDVAKFIEHARTLGKPVVIDPKGNDFSKYCGATVLTPNQHEFEVVAGRCHSDDEFAERGLQLCKQLVFDCLLITRGADGMTVVESSGKVCHLSTRARDVYDVTGAGDTVAAVFALALASGMSYEHSAEVANAAAGLVVAKVGTATVSRVELQATLSGFADSDNDIFYDEDKLYSVLTHVRSNKERIVMTNGCFDLLHPGHVDYLTKAKALGDRLIVAVNDDASVTRLKGEGRPLNSLADRMQMLAALAVVDWVVSFSEETPERLIAKLLPDILVKGSDYEVDQIAGHRQVLEAGGQVMTLDYLEGYSTSEMIAKVCEHGGQK